MAKKSRYAAQWRDRLKELKPVAPAAPITAEITLAGFTFLGKRPPLKLWISSGRLPQGFVRQVMEVKEGLRDEVDVDSLSTSDQMLLVDFQRRVILESVVDPKIVDGLAQNDDEVSLIDLLEVFPDIINEFVNWAVRGCPGIPVQTTDGEGTSVEALETFSEDGQKSILSSSSQDEHPILAQAKRDAEDRRRRNSDDAGLSSGIPVTERGNLDLGGEG